MVLGILCAWAWGVITMKAALATRSTAQLTAQLGALQKQVGQMAPQQPGQSPASIAHSLILGGFMLDTRVTTTYICMLGLFVYLVVRSVFHDWERANECQARIKVAAPKLILFQILAIIIADVFLTTGPLLYSFNGTIPYVLIKPALCAIALSILCNVLFFPESTSYIVLRQLLGFTEPISNFMKAFELSLVNQSSQLRLSTLQQTEAELVKQVEEVEANMTFLSMDVSFCMLDPNDVRDLKCLVHDLVVSILGVIGTVSMMTRSNQHQNNNAKKLDSSKTSDGNEKEESRPLRSQYAQFPDLQEFFADEMGGKLQVESISMVANKSGDLFQVAGDSLDFIHDTLNSINSRRWLHRPSKTECEEWSQNANTLQTRLQSSCNDFDTNMRKSLLDLHGDLFDNEGRLLSGADRKAAPVQGLFLTLIVVERFINYNNSLDALLTRLGGLCAIRTRTQLRLPSMAKPNNQATETQDLNSSSLGPKVSPESSNDHSEKAIEVQEKPPSTKSQHKSPSNPPVGRRRSPSARILLAIAEWLSNDESMFALRVLVVTIALLIPAVCKSSAGFFNAEKGLWAIIMAQTGLVIYTADFIYGSLLRILATIVGAVIGLTAWYIGAGNGIGNPYGIAAIMVPVTVFFMYLRLFFPAHIQVSLVMASTTYLIVAYSWDDTHTPTFENPGAGYTIFWRRMLLVMVGLGAAAVVTLFPRPPSANRHYREVLAETTTDLRDHYDLLSKALRKNHTPIPQHQSTLRSSIPTAAITTSQTLTSILQPIKLLPFELSRSAFTSTTLTSITNQLQLTNRNLASLAIYTSQLPTHLKSRFDHDTGAFSDTRLIGEIMAVLTIIDGALRHSKPLPATLPVPLLPRSLMRKLDRARKLAPRSDSAKMKAVGEDHDIDDEAITKDLISEPVFRKYCIALSAWVQFLGAVDELVVVVREAVGDTVSWDDHYDYHTSGV